MQLTQPRNKRDGISLLGMSFATLNSLALDKQNPRSGGYRAVSRQMDTLTQTMNRMIWQFIVWKPGLRF